MVKNKHLLIWQNLNTFKTYFNTLDGSNATCKTILLTKYNTNIIQIDQLETSAEIWALESI